MYKKLFLKKQYVQYDDLYNDIITVFEFSKLKILCYDNKIKKINSINVKICDDIIYLTNKNQIAILKNCAIVNN